MSHLFQEPLRLANLQVDMGSGKYDRMPFRLRDRNGWRPYAPLELSWERRFPSLSIHPQSDIQRASPQWRHLCPYPLWKSPKPQSLAPFADSQPKPLLNTIYDAPANMVPNCAFHSTLLYMTR